MVIEGKFSDYPVPEVVRHLWQQGATGVLVIRNGDIEKKIVLRDGVPVYATSTVKEERLAYLLLEEGLVRKEDLLAAAQSGKDFRVALLESGKISAEGMEEASRSLIVDIVASAFPWTSGTFQFVERENLRLEGEVDGVPMADLLIEGVQSMGQPDRIEFYLGDLEARPIPVPDPGGEGTDPEVSLDEGEEALLAAVDGNRSLRSLAESGPLGKEAGYALLYGLVLAGRIQVGERPVRQLPRATSKPKLTPKKKAGPRRAVRKSVLKARSGGPAPAKPAVAAKPSTAAVPQVQAAPQEPPIEEDVEKRYTEEDKQTFYEILGVPMDASTEKIRHSYYALARRFHPDKYAGKLPDDVWKKLETVFARVGEAYNVLENPERRKTYDERLRSGQVQEEKKEVRKEDIARESYQKGMIFFERQDYEKAAQFLEHAANSDPTKGAYWEHLALAQSRHPLLRRKAEVSFLKAIQLNPTNYMNYYELGMLYGRAGLLTRAIERLEEALKWDPTNVKMQHALAEFRAQKEGKPLPEEKDKDRKSGGVLGGLFGKKPQS